MLFKLIYSSIAFYFIYKVIIQTNFIEKLRLETEISPFDFDEDILEKNLLKVFVPLMAIGVAFLWPAIVILKILKKGKK